MNVSLKDDINSLSYFKANFNKVLKNIKGNKRPMVITQNGKSAGVFLDMETWETFIKTINLLKLVNEGEVSLKKDKPVSLDAVERGLKKKFAL